MQARALRDYRTQYTHPIRFVRGDVVTLGERDAEWPAFAWTTTADGNAGWAPVDWLQAQGDGRAVALRDYSAQELDVQAGDIVTLLHELGDWWWCTHADGHDGWLPARDLQPINETPSEEKPA
ncbi:MAG: SH3 domain-containing protein [Pseudoxanthomonas sp.]